MDIKNITVILLVLVLIIAVSHFLRMDLEDNTVMSEEHHGGAAQKSYETYPSDVVSKIENNEDIILLDVRTLEEYEEVHLENALLLPVQELSAQSLASIGLGESSKDKEIIIYCRSGARSKTAYDIMNSLGYTNIKSVAGGMIHWEEDNNPFTEKGAYTGSRLITGNKSENTSSGARVSFDRTLHDFGEIPQYGGIVETTFTVKNEGKETLTIGELSTSCTCTQAEISSSEIMAGESAILSVKFDPDLHAEPKDVFKRTIFVPTNDSYVPEGELSIQVDILEGE